MDRRPGGLVQERFLHPVQNGDGQNQAHGVSLRNMSLTPRGSEPMEKERVIRRTRTCPES